MNEGTAGAIKQPVDRTSQSCRVGQGLVARPAGIEKFLFAPGAIVWIDDRAGAPLDLAAERDLDVIGSRRSGRRKDEGAGAATQ